MSKPKILFLFFIAILLPSWQAYAISNQEPMSQGDVLESNSITGTVIEAINAGGYTFLCLENNGEEIWAAIRERPIVIGEVVELSGGPVMTNFISEKQGRTFDKIIFSRGIKR